MEQGTIRDFDQLREEDDAKPSRVATIAFVVLGGASIVFAGLALSGRATKQAAAKADPIGDLLSDRNHPAPAVRTSSLQAREVTFPSILSDDAKPTTALAAVHSPQATERQVATPPTTPMVIVTAPNAHSAPPPAGDRLPVVPLPAQNVMEATNMVKQPRDPLTKEAMNAAQTNPGPTAPSAAGHEGGYQLQVSSFRSQAEAQAFADQLRARGHKAHVTEVNIPSRGGNWYRVRIGPFANQHAAAGYRSSFETHEHVVSFIVPPAGTAAAH